MKLKHLILPAIFFLVSGPVRAEPANISEDTAQGWNPAQATAWMRVQMDYAKAIKQYGKNSPEATSAQVEMNTLARKLGITASDEIPESAPPGPPPAEFADVEVDTRTFKNSPPLYAPAPSVADNPEPEEPAQTVGPLEAPAPAPSPENTPAAAPAVQ